VAFICHQFFSAQTLSQQKAPVTKGRSLVFIKCYSIFTGNSNARLPGIIAYWSGASYFRCPRCLLPTAASGRRLPAEFEALNGKRIEPTGADNLQARY
jgi:hypothetical protein